MTARIVAVSLSGSHRFSKDPHAEVELVAGQGVKGDAHAGVTVKHRSRVAVDPTQANLRQVHLMAAELQAELRAKGFRVTPGVLGENLTTEGIDLLALPRGTLLCPGGEAVIEVTGLRNPCLQLEDYQVGLQAAVLGRTAAGTLLLKAGIMGVVVRGGIVRPGDGLAVELPAMPHETLKRV